MNTIKKTGTHTSDAINVGTKVSKAKSHGATGASTKTQHSGQPAKLSGKGLKTGHSTTNC